MNCFRECWHIAYRVFGNNRECWPIGLFFIPFGIARKRCFLMLMLCYVYVCCVYVLVWFLLAKEKGIKNSYTPTFSTRLSLCSVMFLFWYVYVLLCLCFVMFVLCCVYVLLYLCFVMCIFCYAYVLLCYVMLFFVVFLFCYVFENVGI